MLVDFFSFVLGLLAVAAMAAGIMAAVAGGWLVASACCGLALIFAEMIVDIRED